MRREVIVGLVFVAWALATAFRVEVWRGELALWQATVATSPTNPRAWINLGQAQARAGNRAAAEQAYRMARGLSFDPQRAEFTRRDLYSLTQSNLAWLAAQDGELGAAYALLEDARTTVPDRPWPYFYLGLLAEQQGHCAEARYQWAHLPADFPMKVPPCVGS